MNNFRRGVPLWSPSNSTTDDDFDFMDDSSWSTSDQTTDDDDFDLKITDLPPEGKIDSLLARLATTRTQFASDMRSRLLFRPYPLGRDKSGPYGPAEELDDDFDLQISDLPEDEKPALSGMVAPLANVAARFAPQIRRKHALSLLTVASIAILAMLVVFGGMPSAWNSALSLFAHPTPTPAITSSLSDVSGPPAITGSGRIIGTSHASIFVWGQEDGTPQIEPVQDPLGLVPQDCPQNMVQNPGAAPLSSAIGGTPLWISGFDGNGAALTHLKRANQPGLGWYQQITLLLPSNYPSVVVLQGADMNDNVPLLFNDVASGQGLTALLMLDPDDPSFSTHLINDEFWIVITTNVYVPASGCYSLSAQWTGGSWTVYFAAGK
ncbi:MAG TPA: hypothetical protein VJ761_11785 [Ktedonobacteraceae bacterium]|nr:hypothetical protein [Ktedonobacteraceae bacterium]